MQDLIFSQISIDQLKSELSETLKRELQTFVSLIQPSNGGSEYLDRKTTAKLLGISLPTLNSWTKQGTIIGYRIGSRVRYKRAELETALLQMKTNRRAA